MKPAWKQAKKMCLWGGVILAFIGVGVRVWLSAFESGLANLSDLQPVLQKALVAADRYQSSGQLADWQRVLNASSHFERRWQDLKEQQLPLPATTDEAMERLHESWQLLQSWQQAMSPPEPQSKAVYTDWLDRYFDLSLAAAQLESSFTSLGWQELSDKMEGLMSQWNEVHDQLIVDGAVMNQDELLEVVRQPADLAMDQLKAVGAKLMRMKMSADAVHDISQLANGVRYWQEHQIKPVVIARREWQYQLRTRNDYLRVLKHSRSSELATSLKSLCQRLAGNPEISQRNQVSAFLLELEALIVRLERSYQRYIESGQEIHMTAYDTQSLETEHVLDQLVEAARTWMEVDQMIAEFQSLEDRFQSLVLAPHDPKERAQKQKGKQLLSQIWQHYNALAQKNEMGPYGP